MIINNIKNTKKNNRIKFIAIIGLISLIAILVIIKNFRDNLIFFYAPSEFFSNQKLQKQQITTKIKVGGVVKKNSFNKKDNQQIYFTITDFKQDLTIKYQGILPDLFREEQGVIALGRFYKNDNIFIADELLIKHDENYIPIELKDKL